MVYELHQWAVVLGACMGFGLQLDCGWLPVLQLRAACCHMANHTLPYAAIRCHTLPCVYLCVSLSDPSPLPLPLPPATGTTAGTM